MEFAATSQATHMIEVQRSLMIFETVLFMEVQFMVMFDNWIQRIVHKVEVCCAVIGKPSEGVHQLALFFLF